MQDAALDMPSLSKIPLPDLETAMDLMNGAGIIPLDDTAQKMGQYMSDGAKLHNIGQGMSSVSPTQMPTANDASFIAAKMAQDASAAMPR